MSRHSRSALRTSASLLALLCALAAGTQQASALAPRNTPVLAAEAVDLGRADPTREMKLTVLLQLHDEAGLDASIEKLYDPQSATYRKWLTPGDLSRYAPTGAEFSAVRAELVRHGYQVLSVDPQRFSIRVRGTVAITEKAFQTELHAYRRQNKTFLAHVRDAQLTGDAGALVASVAGLDQHEVHPMLSIAKDPKTGKPRFAEPLTAELAKDITKKITDMALGPQVTQTLTDTGSTANTVFTGLQYSPSGKIVAFTPQQLQAYYGMPALYKLGFTGRGQKIALIDAYGYDAALTDANTFSSMFGLPALGASNFKTVYPEGKATDPNAGELTGWTSEVALDIESVHSLAPDAKIVLVASAGQDNEDQIASIQYVIKSGAAHTISCSWGNDTDLIAGALEEKAFNTVLKLGAAQGYAVQFSSGDSGDNAVGSPVGAPNVPSNSPYATAVGGTSILNDPSSSAFFPTGWGNVVAFLAAIPTGNFNLPLGGAGGGQSVFFAKPSWQKSLPGNFRLVPDVSALADPNTGVVVVVTLSGKQTVTAGFGGTSLASPLFSAIWAIAGEYAGKNLGQAAPALSRLQSGQITEVAPASPVTAMNATGLFTDANGHTTTLSSTDMVGKSTIGKQKQFTSALIITAPNSGLQLLSFGTDSTLLVADGWDEVTGWGEPNGLPFVTAVAK